MATVVTRFAPSPTGHLHIGGARTAIFNYLLARRVGGKFYLRIEDTDRERSSNEMTEEILSALAWLGAHWDGSPIYQSERVDLYNSYVDKLLEAGSAYWCECAPEEVEAMREQARAEGRKPKYSGKCRERALGPGPNRVVRLKTPEEGRLVFEDMVKGHIAWDNAELDDMVLRRPDGAPTYNLAVVVDDHEMGVTHVVRGDDHVNNTPRQIHIYNALGLEPPKFGHVPLIHGQDKKKLSKRHGARSVMEYRDEGFLPEGLFNYLVRMGWAHGDQEIFTRQELAETFTTEGFSPSPAAFDPDKLLWVNHRHIQNATPECLAPLLGRHLFDQGREYLDEEMLLKLIPLYQPRARTLVEMAEGCEFFVMDDDRLSYDDKALKKFLTPEARELLAATRELLAKVEPFDRGALEEAMRGFVEEREVKFKAIAQPLRVAITGRTASPGLFETLEVLGRDSSLARLDRAMTL